MNAKKLACAPEDIDIHELWSKIDWDKCERFVQKLQARIVKAQREGRNNKVKALQWMLTRPGMFATLVGRLRFLCRLYFINNRSAVYNSVAVW